MSNTRFFKLTLKGKAEFYEGQFRPNGWFLGQRVRREDAETVHADDFVDAKGTEHITHRLIHPAAIEKSVEYFQDLKYGGLTRKTIAQQKQEYGYL